MSLQTYVPLISLEGLKHPQQPSPPHAAETSTDPRDHAEHVATERAAATEPGGRTASRIMRSAQSIRPDSERGWIVHASPRSPYLRQPGPP